MLEAMFIDWDSSQEWSERYVRLLIAAMNHDFRERNFSIDFHNKLKMRNISLTQLRSVLSSPESYIARYWYKDGNRVGIWNPKNRLLLVWKPRFQRSPSRFMTVFKKANGVAYMQDFPPFREIRGSRV